MKGESIYGSFKCIRHKDTRYHSDKAADISQLKSCNASSTQPAQSIMVKKVNDTAAQDFRWLDFRSTKMW